MKNLFYIIFVLFISSCDNGGYQDCNGIIDGGAYFDECGNCVGGRTGIIECATDCSGVLGGTANINVCGVCIGGSTGIQEDSCKYLTYNNYTYRTEIIGDQVWLAEDLRSLEFNNGTQIPSFNQNEMDTSGVKTVFTNEDDQRIDVYYSGGVVLNGFISPNGWRIPLKSDIEELMEHLGGDSISGGKLKQEGYETWDFPNQFATNETNFSAFGKGYRDINGNIMNKGRKYSFWTSDTLKIKDSVATYFWTVKLSFDSNHALLSPDSSVIGHPIRLIKNN